MRVLVTGVSGFVGRHLALALKAAGHEVHGLGLQAAPAELGLTADHTADLALIAQVEAALAASRPDAIVNLAGQASAARSFEDPFETFRVNTAGALTLLEGVRRQAPRARVLMIGSGESYGPQAAGTLVAESAPFRPVSPYALSKAAADSGGAAFAKAHGLDVVRTRSFAHSGPGQDPRFVIPSFAQQIARIERGEAEPVLRVGNLEVTRDISDVRDVAEGYRALLERGVNGAAYNVCRGQGVTLSNVAARLCALARVPVRVEVDPARVRPVDVPYLVGDPSAIARDTGWRTGIPFDRTLVETLEDWRNRG
ncbi:MAG: GDP-mannose 4,6-dehydratase [Candidatus Eisenbacteria bacterium]